MKIVIDRAKWRTGPWGQGDSELLNGAGYRCCLGFLGVECGLDDNLATEEPLPSHVKEYARWPLGLFADGFAYTRGFEREWEDIFAAINDYQDIDDATRESWIKEGFLEVLGVEVEFVGEYS